MSGYRGRNRVLVPFLVRVVDEMESHSESNQHYQQPNYLTKLPLGGGNVDKAVYSGGLQELFDGVHSILG